MIFAYKFFSQFVYNGLEFISRNNLGWGGRSLGAGSNSEFFLPPIFRQQKNSPIYNVFCHNLFAAVHTILKDVYDPSVYFRFQPELSEDIAIDESKPEKLSLLCNDAEKYISSNRPMLEKAVTSLMAPKQKKQKMQMWFNSSWNRVFGKVYPQN